MGVKKNKGTQKNLIILSVALLGLITSLGVYTYARQNTKDVADCNTIDITQSDLVTINADNSGWEVSKTTATQCDNLFLINNSDDDIRIAFGTHNDHYEYPLYTESEVAPGDFLEIPLVQHGTFLVHNHHDENQKFELTVTEHPEAEQNSRSYYKQEHSGGHY